MNEQLVNDAMQMVSYAITQALPDAAVQRALQGADLGSGKLVLVAAGKAAWQMASAACQELGDRIHSGVVITKYEHAQGELPNLEIYEAGHPVPDENSFAATRCAMQAVEKYVCDDSFRKNTSKCIKSFATKDSAQKITDEIRMINYGKK